MTSVFFKEPMLHFGIIIALGALGYLLGIGVFLSGALVMAGNEDKTQTLLVFLFNFVARPFSVLVVFGPLGIGFGWAFLLIAAGLCKRILALSIFLALMIYALALTGKQFPAIYDLSRTNSIITCCTVSSEAIYLFVFPSLILISVFFILILNKNKN